MTITDALLGEHGVFYAQFRHLEEELPQAASAETIRARARLLAAALESHAALEDQLLFDRMEGVMPSDQGPLAVMREEHRHIENLLLDLKAVAGLTQAVELLNRVIEVARNHFAKEEAVLFPLAGRALEPAILQDLGREWARRRGVVLAG